MAQRFRVSIGRMQYVMLPAVREDIQRIVVRWGTKIPRSVILLAFVDPSSRDALYLSRNGAGVADGAGPSKKFELNPPLCMPQISTDDEI